MGRIIEAAGDGSKTEPGIKWWLEFVRDKYGPYVAPPGGDG
jgi:hypothetical protein